MADQVPAADKTPAVDQQIATLEKSVGDITTQNVEFVKSLKAINDNIEVLAKQKNYGGATPGLIFGGAPGPHVTTGPLGERGYSYLRAAKFANGIASADEAKEEVEISRKLHKHYGEYSKSWHYQSRGMLIPIGSEFICDGNEDTSKLRSEVRQKSLASIEKFDPEEAQWMRTKALGTVQDTAGGVLVGYPQLMELIELQRNREVFANAGAREIPLPPNGRMTFPKQTAGATANWIGEAAANTESTPSTGQLQLEAKKLGVFVKMNNESMRFANPATEMMLREDMARVAAIAIDLAQLQGTGGTQIKGLITYSDITSYTFSAASGVGTNGYTFTPQDPFLMESKLPDAVQDATAYVMRRDMYGFLAARRSDAVAAGDQSGQFVNNQFRTGQEGPFMTLNGAKVVRSAQVSNTRSKGGASNLTYALVGYFLDWITARFGVMEVLTTNQGDTAFQNDQTWFRGIQHIDAGPRHAASFVLADQIIVA
jgi:HK97 family phage major capsid protein